MPFPYRKILCPVDFNDNSVAAIKEAAALALSSGALLHLLHVVQINPLTFQGAAEGVVGQEFYDAQVQSAMRQAERLAEAIPRGVKHEITIEIGEPGDLIVAAQRRLGSDLIVMATHARRGLKRLVLGSVAERVVRESEAPVLTVSPVSSEAPS